MITELEWIAKAPHLDGCRLRYGRLMGDPGQCSCGRNELLAIKDEIPLGIVNTLERQHQSAREATTELTLAQPHTCLLDWAESLLCNAVPMSHCTQEDWELEIKLWRDQKHGIALAETKP